MAPRTKTLFFFIIKNLSKNIDRIFTMQERFRTEGENQDHRKKTSLLISTSWSKDLFV